MRGIKSTLINLYKKATDFDKSTGVVNNGESNDYPEKVDRFINNSVTALSCANLKTNYIIGKGFGSFNDVKLGDSTLLEVARKITKSVVRQNGVYINFHYNANFEPSGVKILPFANMRNGKKDDEKYTGKYGYAENWVGAKKDDVKWFHAFNPKKEVVQAQIQNCKGNTLLEKVKNYKGQVLYINLTDDYEYPLSGIDAVMSDCDSEAQASLFKNKSLRRGFFGKTMVVTRPLAGDLEDYGGDATQWQLAQTERDNFKKVIQDMLGAENVGDTAHFEFDLQDGEKIDDIIQFKDISSNINDKMFEYTEASVFKNILMAFNSIPPALVRPDNSVFSSSGESIKAMRQVYFDNTEHDRKVVKQIINKITGLLFEETYDLEPLIKIENEPIN